MVRSSTLVVRLKSFSSVCIITVDAIGVSGCSRFGELDLSFAAVLNLDMIGTLIRRMLQPPPVNAPPPGSIDKRAQSAEKYERAANRPAYDRAKLQAHAASGLYRAKAYR